jgi:hypothetical protein
MKDYVLGAVRGLCVGLACLIVATACDTTNAVISPDPLPSPSPVPAAQYRVLVHAEGRVGGQISTGVEAGHSFKISGTPTQCFDLTGKPLTACPVIPRWHQEWIGGFEAACVPAGAIFSNTVEWTCHNPSLGATFKVSAEDWDGTILGDDTWVMYVG